MTKLTEVKEFKQRPNTQWAAQYLVAGELARRNYTVAFTLGNMPSVDLIVTHLESGRQFLVDVKGLSKKSTWLVELEGKPTVNNLYYILVYVDRDRKNDQFHILTQDEARHLRDDHKRQRGGKGSLNRRGLFSGFPFNFPNKFEGRWDHLPPNAYAPATPLST